MIHTKQWLENTIAWIELEIVNADGEPPMRLRDTNIHETVLAYYRKLLEEVEDG